MNDAVCFTTFTYSYYILQSVKKTIVIEINDLLILGSRYLGCMHKYFLDIFEFIDVIILRVLHIKCIL